MRVSVLYNSSIMQSIIAFLIFANFIMNCVQAEMNPERDSDLERAFGMADIAFNVFFTLELIVNLFAHWFYPFFKVGLPSFLLTGKVIPTMTGLVLLEGVRLAEFTRGIGQGLSS